MEHFINEPIKHKRTGRSSPQNPLQRGAFAAAWEPVIDHLEATISAAEFSIAYDTPIIDQTIVDLARQHEHDAGDACARVRKAYYAGDASVDDYFNARFDSVVATHVRRFLDREPEERARDLKAREPVTYVWCPPKGCCHGPQRVSNF
jgi:hypothetical protein